MAAPSAIFDVNLLREHLAEVSEHESELTDRVYASLFTKRPDAEELFGTYSRASQERMMTETLTAVLYILDREPWLDEYVHAMGSRHQFSYETPTDLYAPYADAVLGAVAAVSGPQWTSELAAAWTAALDQVNEMMTAGYMQTSH